MTITTPPADSLMSYNRLLILEEFDKTSHVMAEENYAIDDILKKIKFLVEEDRKSK